MAFNWECPFCERSQSVVSEKFHSFVSVISVGKNDEGQLCTRTQAIGCANPACQKTTVLVSLGNTKLSGGDWTIDQSKPVLASTRLRPQSGGKVFPEFIPQAIRDDYKEACLIRDLSPKASATLARRCLQGMIRDFAKPKTKSDKLFAEIKALEDAIADGTAPREISEDSVAALTAVRKVGNIGAHMEADVDVIVEVDAGEAQVLIELIESLLQDWYVERHKRASRFASAVALAADKQAQLEEAKLAALPAPAIEQSDGS